MKVKIHFITQIFLLIALFAGYFHEILTMYACLLVHEIGHLIMIWFFKKKIELLEISPLGGILHIEKCQNDQNLKELLIYLGGPFASLMLYLALSHFSSNEILIKSSFYVLILNLLPILPLDGARLLMCVKQMVLPYRKVLTAISLISIACILVGIGYFIHNLNYTIILLFFLYMNLKQYTNIPYDYYHFLFYKFIHPNLRLKTKMILTKKSPYALFYKGYNQLFFINQRFIPEEEVLNQLFNKNKC